MTIGITTLGMFSHSLETVEISMTHPLSATINSTNIVCTLRKTGVSASVSAINLAATTKDTKLAINLNSDELKLEVKET